MIETVWPYLAVMLLAAGLFPSLEKATAGACSRSCRRSCWTYLLVTALAVAGLWSPTPEIQTAQRALTAQLLPALLFLLMVTCDLRAILAVGPRVLAVFACAMVSILVAIVLVYLLFRSVLPHDGWKMLAALSATWTGGSANLVAVKQVIGLSESSLPPVLLADALCYSIWVLVLFSTGAFAPAFNRWTRADESTRIRNCRAPRVAEAPTPAAFCCGWASRCWSGWAPAQVARSLPVSTMLTHDVLDRADRDGRRADRRAHAAGAHSGPDAAGECAAGAAGRGARPRRAISRAWRRRRCSSCAGSARC